MKTLRIVLVAGSALAVVTGAQAGSSFRLMGSAEKAPSMIERGEPAPATQQTESDEGSSGNVDAGPVMAANPEMPAHKSAEELAGSSVKMATGETASQQSAAENADSGPSKPVAEAAAKPSQDAPSPTVSAQRSQENGPGDTPPPAVDPTTTASASRDEAPLGQSPFNFSELRH